MKQATNHARKKTAIIIGAGYTGLVAALRAAQQGYSVTILEAGTTIGGLASDFTVEGASLERAYHHIFKTDTDIIALAEELGVSNKLVWKSSSVSLYYANVLYPFKGALDLIKFSPLPLLDRLRAGLVVLYLQKTTRWEKLQGISAYHWMRKAAGENVSRVIWEPLLRGKFSTYYDKVSMAWLWARIHVRAQSRETGGEKLGYFQGGFQTLTDALIAKLSEHNVSIQTGVSITAIKSLSDKRVKIVTKDKTIRSDVCIATVPSHVFANLVKDDEHVSERYLSKLQSIKYLGARLMIFSSTQDISPYYWHNINDVDLPFLVFIHHTKFIDKKNYNGKYIYYTATYVKHDSELFNYSDKQLERVWFDSLKKVFPNFNESKVREKHFFRFANAQHIVDAGYQNKIPRHTSPLPNVFLYNFSQIYPEDRGTNFAVREGNVAGNSL